MLDSACIDLPDEKWGEKVVAVVALKEGMDEHTISAEDIQDCYREQLAGYKRPKQLVFIDSDEMPHTASGKIIHRKLQERLRGV